MGSSAEYASRRVGVTPAGYSVPRSGHPAPFFLSAHGRYSGVLATRAPEGIDDRRRNRATRRRTSICRDPDHVRFANHATTTQSVNNIQSQINIRSPGSARAFLQTGVRPPGVWSGLRDLHARHASNPRRTVNVVVLVEEAGAELAAWASETNRSGNSGRYFRVVNCASENGLSFDTRVGGGSGSRPDRPACRDGFGGHRGAPVGVPGLWGGPVAVDGLGDEVGGQQVQRPRGRAAWHCVKRAGRAASSVEDRRSRGSDEWIASGVSANPRGAELASVMRELIGWGVAEMRRGVEHDVYRNRWSAQAVEALLKSDGVRVTGLWSSVHWRRRHRSVDCRA